MEQRTLGRTGREVSVVGLGTWQLGADWGEVSEADAHAVLEASVEAGVTFFDTADVYGDGRSEQVIGSFLAIMLWAYYAMLIVLFGAEYVRVRQHERVDK